MSYLETEPFEKAFISIPVGKLKIKESEYDPTGSICVVDQGQSLVSGKTNRTDLQRDDCPYIVFGDHTRVAKFVDFPFVVGADGVRLYKASDKYEPEFLYLFLKSSRLPEDGYGRHSKYLKDLRIPVISKEKQRQIAAHLKAQLAEVDKARQAAEVQRGDIEPLRAAIFREAFADIVPVSIPPKFDAPPDGWVWHKLTDIAAEEKIVISPDTTEAANRPYLGLEQVEAQTGKILNYETNSVEGKSNTFAFNQEHVLYGKLRPYLNKVALPDRKGRCSTEIIPLRPINVDREYLALLLRTNNIVDAVMAEKTGSRMPRADMNVLLNVEVSVPDTIEKQRQIAARLKAQLAEVDKTRQAAEAQREDLAALPKRLLAQAFKM